MRILFDVSFLLIGCTQGELSTWSLVCQQCQALSHECYGLPNKVCGQCQRDKKTCQDVVVEGESLLPITLVLVLTQW